MSEIEHFSFSSVFFCTFLSQLKSLQKSPLYSLSLSLSLSQRKERKKEERVSFLYLIHHFENILKENRVRHCEKGTLKKERAAVLGQTTERGRRRDRERERESEREGKERNEIAQKAN
jgi:hypothetical protein